MLELVWDRGVGKQGDKDLLFWGAIKLLQPVF